MTLSFTGRKRLRKYFGKMVEVAQMPNLIEVQKTSYDQFLQVAKPNAGRLDEGLQAVFAHRVHSVPFGKGGPNLAEVIARMIGQQ